MKQLQIPELLTGSFLVLFMAGCTSPATELPVSAVPTEVRTLTLGARPEGTDSISSISYSGTVEANKTILVSAEVSGIILRLPVQTGQYVSQGQLIAELDGSIYFNKYMARQAQTKLAKENYDRILNVYNKGSIAEIKMLEARSEYEQSEAIGKAIYQDLVHTKIYAPVSGYVGSKGMEAGNRVEPGASIVSLLDISQVKIKAPIPEDEVNKYKAGDKAVISIPALENAVFEGTVDEVFVTTDAGTPIYTVNLLVKNRETRLKPGMVANIVFAGRPKPRRTGDQGVPIIIPEQTVQVDEKGNQFVYVLSSDGHHAQRRTLHTSSLMNNGIIVSDGLSAGDQLIITGYHKLTDGSLITHSK